MVGGGHRTVPKGVGFLNPERSQAVRGLALALEGQDRNQEAIVNGVADLKLAPRGEYIDEAREHLRKLVNPTG